MEVTKELPEMKILAKQAKVSIYLMVFVFGGIFGFIYEELFYRIDLGMFVKRGTTFGPWIPIYGFGAMLIIFATNRFRKQPWVVFALSVVVSGLLEFATGYVLYHTMRLRLWDYNVEIWNWMNIGGYVCLRSVLFFGVSALFLQYVVYPILVRATERYHMDRVLLFSGILSAMFFYDILISMFYGSKW